MNVRGSIFGFFLLLSVFPAYALTTQISSGERVEVNSQKFITAIYGLNIQNKLYDVSFNQAFGTVDAVSLSVDPYAAASAISYLANFLGDSFYIYPQLVASSYPRFDTASTWSFQVKENDASAQAAQYGAGWVCCFSRTISSGDLVSFAVPVPETDTSVMLLTGFGLLGFVTRRRKFSR